MKSQVLLFCLFFSTQIYAQFPKSPNAYDEAGLKTGHWTILYDSAWKTVYSEDSAAYYRLITFEKGKPAGKVRDFYRSGQKQFDGFLISTDPDVPDGDYKTYHQNGKLNQFIQYKNGKQNGISRQYSNRGVLRTDALLKKDTLHGKYRYFHENGNLYFEGEMVNGLLQGDLVSYHDNGVESARGNVVDGEKEGRWRFQRSTGVVEDISYYHAGRLNGDSETYDEEGRLTSKGQYKDDFKDGHWQYYFSDSGRVKEEGYFQAPDGKTGVWKEYFPDGNLKLENVMVKDVRHGSASNYYQNTALQSKGDYVNGEQKGSWIFYYENGKVQCTGEYLTTDTLHGPWIYYFDTGELNAEGNYDRGNREGLWKYYDRDGALTLQYHINDLIEGLWVKRYINGQVADTMQYVHNLIQGARTLYYPNGTIQAKMNYVDHLLEGAYQSWYEDGTVNIKCFYVRDTLHGSYLSYHPNGKLYIKAFYDRGVVTRSYEEYYEDGKPKLLKKYKDGHFTWVDFFASGSKKSEGKGIFLPDGTERRDGFQKVYFSSGQMESEGVNINGHFEGKFTFYDSLGNKKTEGPYLHSRYNGKWKFYDERGKLSSVSYYVDGFLETSGNIADSIKNLIDLKEFELALGHIDWYKKVLKREQVPSSDVMWIKPTKWLGDIYYGKEDYEKALGFFSTYRDEVSKLQGDTVTNYTLALNGIANAHAGMRNYKLAFEINEQLRKRADPDSWDGAVYLYNNALNLFYLGSKEQAWALLENEWKRRSQTFGDSSRATIDVWNMAASFQLTYTGDFEDALHSYVTLMDVIAPGDEYYLRSLRSISDCYKYLDDKDKAIEWLIKAIEYQREHHLDGFQDYAIDVTSLADRYIEKGLYTEALNLLKEGLERMRDQNRLQSFNAVRLIHKTSMVFLRQFSDPKTALKIAIEAKRIMEETGNTENALYSFVIYTIGNCHFLDPLTFYEGEKYYLLSTEINRKKYGETSENYFSDLVVTASYYTVGYQFQKADSLLNLAEPLIIEHLGVESSMYATCMRRRAELYSYQNRYADAIEAYKKSYAYYERNILKESAICVSLLQSLSTSYEWTGDYTTAEALIRKALTISEEYLSKNNAAYYDVHNSLAGNLQRQGLYQEAIDEYNITMKGYEEYLGEDNNKHRQLLYDLATLYSSLNEYRLAEEYFEKAIRHAQQHSAPPFDETYFRMLQALAQLKSKQLKLPEADKLYQDAVAAAKPYSHGAYYFLLLQDYGTFLTSQARYSQAEVVLTEAAAHAAKLAGTEHSFYTSIAVDLSKVYNSLGRYTESDEMLNKALENATRFKNESHSSYLPALRAVAINLRAVGRYEDSEKIFNNVLTHVAATYGRNSDWYGVELLNVVSLYVDWKKYTEAKQSCREAISIFEEVYSPDNGNVITAYNQLGLIALREDSLELAHRYFLRNKEVHETAGKTDKESYATALHNVATALRRTGKFSEAEQLYMKSLQLRKQYGFQYNPEVNATIKDDVAILYHSTGKFSIAAGYWEETLSGLLRHIHANFPAMSDYERTKFWARNKSNFEYFNSFAIDYAAKNPTVISEMYNYRLATKGILLNASNKVRKRIYASQDSVLISHYHQWAELRQMVANEYSGVSSTEKTPIIDSLEREIIVLEKELSLSTDDANEDKSRFTTWRDVQRSLSSNEAAVEFVRFSYFNNVQTDSVLYAALIVTSETKSNPLLVVYPDGAFLEGKAYRYYRNSIVNQLADDLSYSHYWLPLEKFLKNKTKIFVSLDGVFNQVNLTTIRRPDGDYLMEEKDFIAVSNTRDVVAMKSRKRLRLMENASLIGNPKFFIGESRSVNGTQRSSVLEDRSGISELPGTGVEVSTISTLLQGEGWNVNSLTGHLASESNIKQLPSSRILHFATHGFFNETADRNWSTSDPMLRAGILLTGAANFLQGSLDSTDRENGILTAYEAANLSLEGTEMVVLSACETARGEIQQGEGVYGLQRAFITAGAESLVMSLWKVDDTATQKLMTLFYENWMKGMEKNQALHEAQKSIRKIYDHPYYWGAFVMIRG